MDILPFLQIFWLYSSLQNLFTVFLFYFFEFLLKFVTIFIPWNGSFMDIGPNTVVRSLKSYILCPKLLVAENINGKQKVFSFRKCCTNQFRNLEVESLDGVENQLFRMQYIRICWHQARENPTAIYFPWRTTFTAGNKARFYIKITWLLQNIYKVQPLRFRRFVAALVFGLYLAFIS